ncbi:MAG: hypothetical protein WB802_14630 [Candidatus Dormiibacterota bacterium]|jgi:hypothetical protein
MSYRTSPMRSLLAGLVAAAAVTACGGTSSPPSSSSAAATPAATPTPTPTPAGAINTASCPAPSVVNGALGTDFTASTTVSSANLVATLPSGTGHIACTYTSGSAGVILILLNHIPASLFTTEEQDVMALLGDRGFNVSGVTSTPVSGLGDEAVSFTTPSVLYGSAVGVDVQQGTNRVVAFEGQTTPSLSAVESLATQLLG